MFKVLGISDEKNVCECCGKINLKCTVALETDSENGIIYYGRDCAAKALLGNNKSAAMKTVESLARGISFARKWIDKPGNTLQIVANAVCVRFYPCSVENGEIVFPNGVCVRPE